MTLNKLILGAAFAIFLAPGINAAYWQDTHDPNAPDPYAEVSNPINKNQFVKIALQRAGCGDKRYWEEKYEEAMQGCLLAGPVRLDLMSARYDFIDMEATNFRVLGPRSSASVSVQQQDPKSSPGTSNSSSAPQVASTGGSLPSAAVVAPIAPSAATPAVSTLPASSGSNSQSGGWKNKLWASMKASPAYYVLGSTALLGACFTILHKSSERFRAKVSNPLLEKLKSFPENMKTKRSYQIGTIGAVIALASGVYYREYLLSRASDFYTWMTT